MFNFVGDESFVQFSRFVFEDARDYLNAGGAKHGDSGSIDERIGVRHASDNFGHTSIDQRLRAGRGPALMRAWLQIRVDGRAASCVTGLLERDDFGMTDAIVSVEAFADDAAILDDKDFLTALFDVSQKVGL